jgi:hypothetical protein
MLDSPSNPSIPSNVTHPAWAARPSTVPTSTAFPTSLDNAWIHHGECQHGEDEEQQKCQNLKVFSLRTSKIIRAINALY